MVNRNENTYRHLQMRRVEPVIQRRSRGGAPPVSRPEAPSVHGAGLRQRLQELRETTDIEVGGFDSGFCP